jgi:predicted protein tyrosine phosphatase
MKQPRLNVLFVCSRNQWRSPTAEKLYEKDEGLNVRSRGTSRNAVQTITASDIKWSSVILVMEDKHRKRILATFPDEARYKPLHVLDIPDDYRFMELDLISLISSAADPIIESMLKSNPKSCEPNL